MQILGHHIWSFSYGFGMQASLEQKEFGIFTKD